MKQIIRTAVVIALVSGCNGGSGSDPGQVFFGDLHAHSTLSAPDRVGNATPEDFYRVARDDIKLDFAALSDHDSFLTPEEWDEIRATAPLFDDPGTFVAFPAIEWTHRWHMNTVFRHDDEEMCDCIEAPAYYDHHRDLVEARDAASHLNHPTDIFLPVWSQIDDTLTKNVEIFNASSSDQEHGYSGAIWSLRAGFRFGFVGVSDDHMTDAMPPRIGNGITGCHAAELTREAILDALHDRRCFATTRERIIVDTEVAGVAMGGMTTAEIGAIVPARVTVTATAVPVDIELVHNGLIVDSVRCDRPDCRLTAQIRIDDPNNFVYARILQPGDQRAWSTPVWIDAHCPGGERKCLLPRLAGGGGDGGDDCLAEFLFPADASADTYGQAPALVRCRDNDPACDAGDTAGECEIRIGLCFGVDDRRLPACAPARAESFAVLEPSSEAPRLSTDWENRSTLEAIYQAAHTSADKNACSGIAGLRVPAGQSRTFTVESRSAERTDRDELVAECLAAADLAADVLVTRDAAQL
jgi:hypothetical protein